MRAKTFDTKFDSGGTVTDHSDLSKSRRINAPVRRSVRVRRIGHDGASFLARGGMKKGDLAKLVEEAVRSRVLQ
jgi:histone acetyltransferase (RNA polymerase elongator complex component)